ncbi:MAG: hypothetical protein ACYDAK_06075 [Candidatus Limnocylindrales bacterium]
MVTGGVATFADCAERNTGACAVGTVGFVAGSAAVGSTVVRGVGLLDEVWHGAISIPGDLAAAGISFVGWITSIGIGH